MHLQKMSIQAVVCLNSNNVTIKELDVSFNGRSRGCSSTNKNSQLKLEMVILMTKELNLPWTPYTLGIGNPETQNTAILGGQVAPYVRQHNTDNKVKHQKNKLTLMHTKDCLSTIKGASTGEREKLPSPMRPIRVLCTVVIQHDQTSSHPPTPS